MRMKIQAGRAGAFLAALCLILSGAAGRGEGEILDAVSTYVYEDESGGEQRSEFELSGDTLIAVHGLENASTVSVPSGVRVIGPAVFRGMTSLERVVLPDSVEEIQSAAFAGCTALQEIAFSSGNGLRIIGSRAFLNCRRLDQSFAYGVEQIAGDAFEEGPPAEETVIPQPAEETEIPQPEEETATPEPAEEEDSSSVSADSSGSGSRSGTRQTHGRAKEVITHGYDQVSLVEIEKEAEEPVRTLTLDGEALELTLTGADGKAWEFTASLYDANDPDEEDGEQGTGGNTLILRAVRPAGTGAEEEEETGTEAAEQEARTGAGETVKNKAGETSEPQTDPSGETPEPGTESSGAPEEDLTWEVNGAVLRKMSRSGIAYLVFRSGDRMTAVPTEGFLAGWAYEELKSRGTPGRRFDYRCVMPGEEETPRWSVTVEGETWEPGWNVDSAMYLTGVRAGGEEILKELKEE